MEGIEKTSTSRTLGSCDQNQIGGVDMVASLPLFVMCRQGSCSSLRCRRKGTHPMSKNCFIVPEFSCELERARGPSR
jgi:hypothetical protein